MCDPEITEVGRRQSEHLAEFLAADPPDHLYCSGFLRSLQTTAIITRRLQLRPYVHSLLYEAKGCFSGYREGELRSEPGLGSTHIVDMFGDWEIDPEISHAGWHHGREVESESETAARAAVVAAWMSSLATSGRITIDEAVTGPDKVKLQADIDGAVAKSADRIVRRALVIHADFKMQLLSKLLGNCSDDALAATSCSGHTSQSAAAGYGRIAPWLQQVPLNTSVTTLEFSGGRWRLIEYNSVRHLPESLRTL